MKTRIKLSLLVICLCFSACTRETEPETPKVVEYPLGLLESSASVVNAVPLAAVPFAGNLASSHDLSPNMPPVGNQGAQGSCVAWSVGYGMKSYQEKMENNYSYCPSSSSNCNFQSADASRLMSPAFVFNQIKVDANDCRQGTYFETALDLLKTQGICSLADMPYAESDCNTQPNSTQRQKALANKIEKYERIDLEASSYQTDIKALIFSGKPVIIGAEVGDGFMALNYSNNHWNASTQGTIRGRHAMLLVGYDDSKNAFKVMNSWGTNWGDAGFCWLDYDFFKNAVFVSFVAWDIQGNTYLKLSGNLDFGVVPVNTTSASKTLTITNVSSSVINVYSLAVPDGFTATFNGDIQPGSSVNVQVTFSPITAGTFTGKIGVNHNIAAGTIAPAFIDISGVGTANNNSVLQISGDMNFGAVTVGGYAKKSLTLTNTSASAINIFSFQYSQNGFSGNFNGDIQAGASQPVEITFTPTQVQNYQAELEVNYNPAPLNAPAKITLTGAGISNQPNITSVPNLNTFVECPTMDIQGSGNCTGIYIANTIRCRVTNISGNFVTFELARCNPNDKMNYDGIFYIKENDYCGQIVSQQAYIGGTPIVSLTVPLTFSGSKQYHCVVVSNNGYKYFGGYITLTR